MLDPANITIPGIYRITANNGGECSDTAFITVVLKPSPYIGADKIVSTCQLNPINLNSQYNTSGYTFNWSTNGSVTSPVVATSNIYRLIVFDSWGCTDTAFLTLTVNPSPVLVS